MANSHIMFDGDGVLIDSIIPHAQFLRDVNRRLKLQLSLPEPQDKAAWRAFSESPMNAFVKNAGFPDLAVPIVLEIYQREFSDEKYLSPVFEGIDGLILNLRLGNNAVSILTMNHGNYIIKSLGKTAELIDFIIDKNLIRRSFGGKKSIALSRLKPSVYVGDMESDYFAAEEAGVPFIGVSYGWEIRPEDKRFPVVTCVSELKEMLSRY